MASWLDHDRDAASKTVAGVTTSVTPARRALEPDARRCRSAGTGSASASTGDAVAKQLFDSDAARVALPGARPDAGPARRPHDRPVHDGRRATRRSWPSGSSPSSRSPPRDEAKPPAAAGGRPDRHVGRADRVRGERLDATRLHLRQRGQRHRRRAPGRLRRRATSRARSTATPSASAATTPSRTATRSATRSRARSTGDEMAGDAGHGRVPERALHGEAATPAAGPERMTLARRSASPCAAPALSARRRRARPSRSTTCCSRGGHVIDPKNGLSAVRDVAIAGGKIAAVAERIDPAEAFKVGRRLGPLRHARAHRHARPRLRGHRREGLVRGRQQRLPRRLHAARRRHDRRRRRLLGLAQLRGLQGPRHRPLAHARPRLPQHRRQRHARREVRAGPRRHGRRSPTAEMALQHKGLIVGIKTAHYEGPEWTPVERAVEAGTIAGHPGAWSTSARTSPSGRSPSSSRRSCGPATSTPTCTRACAAS